MRRIVSPAPAPSRHRATPARSIASGISHRRGRRHLPRRLAAGLSALLAGALAITPLAVQAQPSGAGLAAVVAPVGQGFDVTKSDLKYILDQIQIAERHTRTLTPANPCGTLVGTGANQISTPLIAEGLRTVDGSCNNLQPGQETFGAADEVFPRISSKSFRDAEERTPFGPPGQSSYTQKSGSVVDSEPRTVSNLIVDQTSTNPAAVAAAGNPVRSQGTDGAVPCTTDPDPFADPPVAEEPAGCVPTNQTLFIPNVTTDVGLSPPYNSMFTLFGQFFDHGIDQTVKGGGTVFITLKNDDPLVTEGPDGKAGTGDEVPPNQRFMVLTRGKNQVGNDGQLGTADDVQDALNTDSPWVDQSQTYASHASHQVFLREYALVDGAPVSTGKLLSGVEDADGHRAMGTWADLKTQAADLLGLQLADKDTLDVPMMAADPYGNFVPGPNGLPQYVTATGLVEGDLTSPVPVPANVLRMETPFLTDIAHNAVPGKDRNGVPLTPDPDTTASADFASQLPGTYDDEMLDAHFVAGDGRLNENIGLTAVHQVFHSEHDRLVDAMKTTLESDTSTSGLAELAQWQAAVDSDPNASADAPAFDYGDRLFQAARFVTEMEYQHIVFEDFARKVQPGINPFAPFAFTETDINPAVKAEFAHAVYRFGHSMLTETISRRNEGTPGADGVYGTKDDKRGSENNISLLDGFLNPPSYFDGGPDGPLTAKEAAGSIVMGMSDQVGNEIDEFTTDTLRNNLLGLPLDLPAINMARGRSEGIPTLNDFRREVYAATNDGAMKPYLNWIDFGENIKHPESLVNFVAAYGQHESITSEETAAGKREAARLIVRPSSLEGDVPPPDASDFMNSTGTWANRATGLDGIDLWVGGLAEQTLVFGGLLGPTFNYVFENQMTELQNGDRLYYLARTPGMNLRAELEGNSFAELVMRNTNAEALKADSFATADCKFEMKNLDGTQAGFTQFGNTVADDADSECDEGALLIRMSDGTIKYKARNSVDPSGINGQGVYNGTSGVDRVYAGNDSDTVWGGPGNDIIEGGDGADVTIGGEGDDILTDLGGDDVPKGGPGNDAIDAGPGLDILMGGAGNDFSNGGANANETFGGEGNDFMMLGESLDTGFGDGGDDYQEGGAAQDLMIGDSSNMFFLDNGQRPGSDVLVGQGGDDDYDMEGGDDIGVAGPGIEKAAGASGYDWQTGIADPQPQEMDLALPFPADAQAIDVRDRFDEVEALSGGDLDDTLRGDDIIPTEVGGDGSIGCDALDQAGLDRIQGLDPLVPALNTPLADVVAASTSKECPILEGPMVWGDGNILLGGGGSDLIEGRGADDIIDGDRYLSVRLSVRNAAGVEIGSASVNRPGQSAMTSQYLRDGLGALTGPTLQAAVFAGQVNPGDIVLVREILTGGVPADVDTAIYSGFASNYTITTDGATTTVSHNNGNGVDGTDTVRNVEKLRFADQTVTVAPLATAPDAPTGASATAGDQQATVTWSAPANDGGSEVTSYTIEVSTAGTLVDTVTGIPAGDTNRVITGLTNGTAYTFVVKAVNAIGTSTGSAPTDPVTPEAAPPAATVPGRPTIGTAVAGNTAATVNWTAPASDGGSAITRYVIIAYVNGVFHKSVTAPATATTQQVTGLTNNTTYTFRVRARNAIGNSPISAHSNAVTPAATNGTAPTTAPGQPTIGTAVAGNTAATVNWTAPASDGGSAITRYVIIAYVDGVFRKSVTVPATATTRQVTGLTNNTTYTFRVRARNAIGNGPLSAHSNAVTPTATP